MWTKVQKTPGVRPCLRAKPAVRRARSARSASLVLPEGMGGGERADIYTDGNGKLAFAIGDRGTYAVTPVSHSKIRRVTIPSQWVSKIPYGTTDVEIEYDGGMLVLDLNAISAGPS